MTTHAISQPGEVLAAVRKRVDRMLREAGFVPSLMEEHFKERLAGKLLLAELECRRLIQEKSVDRLAMLDSMIAISKAKGVRRG